MGPKTARKSKQASHKSKVGKTAVIVDENAIWPKGARKQEQILTNASAAYQLAGGKLQRAKSASAENSKNIKEKPIKARRPAKIQQKPIRRGSPIAEVIIASTESRRTKVPTEFRAKIHKTATRATVASERTLAERLLAEVAASSPDVNALCKDYGLRREELGRLTGFSLRALAEWAGGKLPSHPAKRRLQEVRRLLDALAEIVQLEAIPEWLHQTNPAFDHLSPLQVIELGEIDRLWSMVYDLGSGQPD